MPRRRRPFVVDTATAARPRISRRYAVRGESRRPVARDTGLIWLLTLLGGLGLLFWSAVVLVLLAFL